MIKVSFAGLALCLAALPHAAAQNAERLLEGVSRQGNTLELATSDGR